MESTLKSSLTLPLPDNFTEYSPEIQSQINAYLTQLSPNEQKAYNIAKEHLGSSFHILRSNGFAEWKKKIQIKIQRI